MHARMHAHIHMGVFSYMHVKLFVVWVFSCVHSHMLVRVLSHMYVRVFIHASEVGFIHVNMFSYMHMWVYLDKHMDVISYVFIHVGLNL